jgi:hypothetical protein
MNKQKLMVLGVLAACIAAAGANPPADDPAAKIAAFDWLTGHWCMEKDGQIVEEVWLPPSGGMLLSVGRTVVSGRVRGFEFLRIEVRDGVVTFVAQPNGTPPTAFGLTAAGAHWARFENPQHDFPRRVEYRRTGPGLHAEIAGPDEGGGERVIPFDYRPCGT